MAAMDTQETQGQLASAASSEVIIELNKVNKWYGDFHVLKDIDLEVRKGERIVVCGPSGSGKSTLIRCINRLEEHQQGDIIVDNMILDKNLKNIDHIRSEVGMVFQSFNLFPHLSILENLTLGPIWVRKVPKAEAIEAAMLYLERVKIPEQADKFPGQLSGGQQQRVAIARAMANDPALILADEPTGNLDLKTGKDIIEICMRLREESGVTIVSNTHDHKMLGVSDRVVDLRDGQVERIRRRDEIKIQEGTIEGFDPTQE